MLIILRDGKEIKVNADRVHVSMKMHTLHFDYMDEHGKMASIACWKVLSIINTP